MNDRPDRAAPARIGPATYWLVGYLLVAIVCQLALLAEQLAAFRIAFRIGTFAIGLVGLVAIPIPGRRHAHPAALVGGLALLVVATGLFHPRTNAPLAAIAQIVLYLAILSPLFWVPRLAVAPADLARFFAVLWGFHTLSAIVGILQVYAPGQFAGNLSSTIADQGDGYVEDLKITLADGQRILRPMGLTDLPGGAASAGFNAFLFGMGFLATSRRRTLQVLGIAAMALGLFCMYLSYIRSVLVVAGVIGVFYFGALLATGRRAAALRVGLVVPIVVLGAFAWAFAVGGDDLASRIRTLTDDRPDEVYRANRGRYLEATFENQLPDHPLGMGLGRWGMVHAYFGDPSNPESPPVWVEIQWTAWAVDGGVLLILLYGAAIAIAIGATARVALRAEPWLAGWATVILAYDVGAVAVTFNYSLFIGQGGLEFWLLNAAIFAAGRNAIRRGVP